MKFIRIIAVFGVVLSLLLLVSCGKKNDTPTATKTVLIYMAADNNLSNEAEMNISSLIKNATEIPNGENLILYIDLPGKTPQLRKINNKGITVVKDYPETSAMSADVMRGVINDALRMFPAEKYGLILWSHGMSWLPVAGTYSGTYSGGYPKTKYFGDDYTGSPKYMELHEMKAALPDRLFDYIIFDACYMGSIEVEYALRDKARYIVASASEVLADGMPYDKIVGDLFGFTEASLVNISSKFFKHYDAMQGDMRSVVTSVVRTSGLEPLAESVKKIIQKNPSAPANMNASDVQVFSLRRYRPVFAYDLEDYVVKIADEADAADFRQKLSQAVVYQNATPYLFNEITVRTHSGLASYIPLSANQSLNNFYKTLDWYKKVYE